MTKAPQKYLAVIGTARRPNSADLRDRGLAGLPDPGPDVALRRAELESEQAALKTQVAFWHGGGNVPVSFSRTKIDRCHGSDDGSSSNPETMREDPVGKVEENHIMHDTVGDEQIRKSTADVDKPTLSESVRVAYKACEAEEGVRYLRDRKPVQLHPYALEREVYRQRVKAGRAV